MSRTLSRTQVAIRDHVRYDVQLPSSWEKHRFGIDRGGGGVGNTMADNSASAEMTGRVPGARRDWRRFSVRPRGPEPDRSRPRRFRLALLSTFPPTQCGLATFTQAKVEHLLQRSDVEVGVIRVVDRPGQAAAPVVHELVTGQRGATRRAAAVINNFDAVIVQHEYGIYGGRDGADILALLADVRVPVISVLHTVLADPTPHQHQVLAGVVRHSAGLVTMTQTGRDRLLERWDVDPEVVHVIPHGAEPNEQQPHDPSHGSELSILTWGLIGPGKGIEWAIESLVQLRDLEIPFRYDVVGQTHPRVREREGEAYRESLVQRARELGVADLVRFDDCYHDSESLRTIARSADLVLLPYDSREQVTSGVLTEAVVAGRPVVSTAFPHAVELLSDGAGILVPQRDPLAMGQALRRVLTEPETAEGMSRRARELAGTLHWGAVVDQYLGLARTLRRRQLTAAS